MKELVCTLDFSQAERGAVTSALTALKEQRVAEGKSNELINSLLERFQEAQFRKVRVQHETAR